MLIMFTKRNMRKENISFYNNIQTQKNYRMFFCVCFLAFSNGSYFISCSDISRCQVYDMLINIFANVYLGNGILKRRAIPTARQSTAIVMASPRRLMSSLVGSMDRLRAPS